MEISPISTGNAPKAIGPYSQAVVLGNLIFTSGQIGIIPETGDLIKGGIEQETKQVLCNLKAVLETGGSSFQNVVETLIFCTNLADFNKINTIYEEAMGAHRPARSTVQVAALPKEAKIEIRMIAKTGE